MWFFLEIWMFFLVRRSWRHCVSHFAGEKLPTLALEASQTSSWTFPGEQTRLHTAAFGRCKQKHVISRICWGKSCVCVYSPGRFLPWPQGPGTPWRRTRGRIVRPGGRWRRCRPGTWLDGENIYFVFIRHCFFTNLVLLRLWNRIDMTRELLVKIRWNFLPKRRLR